MNNIKKLFFAVVMLCGGCAAVGQTMIGIKEVVLLGTLLS